MPTALLPSHLLPDLESAEAGARVSAAFLYFDYLDFFSVTSRLPPQMTSEVIDRLV